MGIGVLDIAEGGRIGEGTVAIAQHDFVRSVIVICNGQIDDPVSIKIRCCDAEDDSLHRQWE